MMGEDIRKIRCSGCGHEGSPADFSERFKQYGRCPTCGSFNQVLFSASSPRANFLHGKTVEEVRSMLVGMMREAGFDDEKIREVLSLGTDSIPRESSSP